MMKTIRFLCLLLCLALLCSCTSAPTETASDTNAESDSEVAPWTLSDGLAYEDGTLKTTEFKELHTAFWGNALPQSYNMSANVSFQSKGYIKFFIESSFEESEIKNGIAITLDIRTNALLLHQHSKTKTENISTTKLDKATTNAIISIYRLGDILEISVYDAEDTSVAIAYVSLTVKQLKGETHAVSMCGNITMSDYKISDIQAGSNDQTYTNPILAINKDLGDPTVYYEDGKYYMLTTGRMNCYVSEDLVNFTDIGVVADTNQLFGKTYYGGGSIFKYDGIYYLFYTSYKPDTDNKVIMCVATSNSVTGPYTQPKQTMVDPEVCPLTSAGAFPFIAEDGKTYLYWYETLSATGNTIFGAEAEFKDGVVTVKKETKKMLVYPTESWEIKSENGASGRVTERPNVFYHNGYYYLFYAGSHWKTSYGQGYAVSTSPLGDYVKYKNNPILDSTVSIHGVGCTYITYSPDKSELFFVYHAHTSITNLQRNVCIDRISFIPNPDGGADIVKVIGPTTTPQPLPK